MSQLPLGEGPAVSKAVSRSSPWAWRRGIKASPGAALPPRRAGREVRKEVFYSWGQGGKTPGCVWLQLFWARGGAAGGSGCTWGWPRALCPGRPPQSSLYPILRGWPLEGETPQPDPFPSSLGEKKAAASGRIRAWGSPGPGLLQQAWDQRATGPPPPGPT